MAWVPSHQELAHHPKTLRLARALNVSVPTAIGHLHLLWHWTLGMAPDGDISKYDPEDIAVGSQWAGDPAVYVEALIKCGPGGSAGFLDPDLTLHDWTEYGGRYFRRSEAGKKAAGVRWKNDGNANADANAYADSENRNAEERRGEEKETPSPAALSPKRTAKRCSSSGDDGFAEWWENYPRKVAKAEASKAWAKALKTNPKPTREALATALRTQARNWQREGRQIDKIPHAARWLNGRRWEDDDLANPKPVNDDPAAGCW
jgi:hypothetical protein